MKQHLCRLTAFFCAALLLLSLSVFPVTAAEDNLLKNADFKSGTTNWNTWSNGSGSFSCEKDFGENGTKGVRIVNTGTDASVVFQYFDFIPGHTYHATARVRFEDVSAEGSGAAVGVSNFDAAGNNIQELVGDGLHGTSDGWVDIEFTFSTNEDAAQVNCGARLWGSTGTLYVDSMTCTEVKLDAQKTSGVYDLTLSETANRHPILVMGCEWDPKLLLPFNAKRGVDEEDLALIAERMKVLGIQNVRMMICPEWFEPENDNDDPHVFDETGFILDNDEMRSVTEQLAVCEKLGIDVILTWWGAETLGGTGWLCYPDVDDWVSAPADLDEMAENIAFLIGYYKNTLKFSCIRGLVLQNEPSYSYRVSGGTVDFDHYERYYRTVSARLAADGLLDDLTMIGSDDAQAFGWYQQSCDTLSDICGMFDSHNYNWTYDMPALDALVQKYVRDRVDYHPEQPFFLGEFGDGTGSGAYSAGSTETYGRGLYVASAAVNALKAGASGLSYWPLHDVYYYDGDPNDGSNGGRMSMGLMGYPMEDGETWTYRPTYYAWGLMCNFAPHGSLVYDITGENGSVIDAVSVCAPDGKWSVFCVNRSAVSQTVRIRADAVGAAMKQYLFSEDTLPTDGNLPLSSGTAEPENGVYTLEIPAWSMVVLTEREDAYRYTPTVVSAPEAPAETVSEGEPTLSGAEQVRSGEAETEAVPGADEAAPAGGTVLYVVLAIVAAVLLLGAAAVVILRKRKK